MSTDQLTRAAQKAARGGLFLFIGNASSTVILAIGIIIVARLLGPLNYGLYTLAVTIPTLLVGLSDVGMNFALVRLPARFRSEGDHAKANRLVRLGFLIKLSVSAVAFLICYTGSAVIAASVLNRPELAPFIQLASLMILFQAIYDATNNSFIGQDLMQYSASTQIMQALLKGTLGPVFVLIGLGITGAISAYVLALAAAGVTGATILFTKHARSSDRATDPASKEMRALLRYGLPLYLANVFSVFLSQYQNILLAHFASNVEIGNFGGTWNFISFMVILTYPIQTAIFPMFSKFDPRNQRTDLARGFTLAVKYSSIIVVPASIAVMIFSRDLILLTYGKGYALAPQYLVLLSALHLLSAIGYLVVGSFLNGVAETKVVVVMSVVTLAIYLPLGPALAWLWGPLGLLIAYIVSNAASTVYGIRQVSEKFNARIDLKASGRVLFAALAAAVPTVGLIQFDRAGVGAINLVVGGLLYLVVYLTLAPILGAVEKQDILNLRTLLGGTRIVAVLVNPVFDYESKLLSVVNRK
jgi:O-antigen/teichoic acid export membrane protein